MILGDTTLGVLCWYISSPNYAAAGSPMFQKPLSSSGTIVTMVMHVYVYVPALCTYFLRFGPEAGLALLQDCFPNGSSTRLAHN